MWSPLFEVKNRYIADVWRELFNAEAVATRVIVLDSSDASGDLAPRQIWVPDSKTHVALEIMRKV
jgi:hypothetical protein